MGFTKIKKTIKQLIGKDLTKAKELVILRKYMKETSEKIDKLLAELSKEKELEIKTLIKRAKTRKKELKNDK